MAGRYLKPFPMQNPSTPRNAIVSALLVSSHERQPLRRQIMVRIRQLLDLVFFLRVGAAFHGWGGCPELERSPVGRCAVLDSKPWIQGPRSRGPGSRALDPRPWIQGPGARPWILGPGSKAVDPNPWIHGPGYMALDEAAVLTGW